MIRFSGLRKVFDDGTVALDGVTVEINKGDFAVVLGPSGSGKTTLLRCVNGLVVPSEGRIKLDGLDVVEKNFKKVRSKVGMIFQQYNLVGNLSVINNVLSGSLAEYKKWYSGLYIFPKELRIKALEVLDRVGLLDKAYQRTDELSGGQQQRVGIARSLIQNPDVLLADEPIASLDPVIAHNILSLLKDICLEEGITVLCSLHQVDFAMSFSQRIIALNEGEVVLDRLTKDISSEYIKKIYKSQGKGMYFGADVETYLDEELITWSEYH